MLNRINNSNQNPNIPHNRPSIRRNISSFFSNIGRLFTLSTHTPTLRGRVLQIPLENNPQLTLTLNHWTEVVLDQWVTEGNPQENRAQAKRNIQDFLSNPINTTPEI